MSARRISQAIALSLIAVMMGSCAVAPAKLVRAHALGKPNCPFDEETMHQLMTLALEDPNQGESAHALAHFIEEWVETRPDSYRGTVEPDLGSESNITYRVSFSHDEVAHFSPSYFDEIRPAVDFEVKRIEHFKEDGVGAPLLALRNNNHEFPIESFYPAEGISRETTALIHPGRQTATTRSVRIEMTCSLRNDSAIVAGKRERIAADYSVALGALLERTGGIAKSEISDLFTPSPTQTPHIYLMEPYDPNKEPLLMIHGLLDSPLGWVDLTNALRAEKKIRSRYQIWHYLYNTSAPALYSGRLLREQLKELRAIVDPDGNDHATHHMTLLTHSMGGIVARGLITDPGDAFWDLGFTRPFSSLKLDPDDRASLQDAFFWKPEPAVNRVIFICVPHRGSKFADNPVGKLGRAFVKPPNDFKAFYERVSTTNPGAFTPLYEDLGSGKLDSVSSLSPKQPTMQILADLPLGHDPELYSIIANRGKDGPLEDSSDGIVEYWSSHIDNAVMETIVPYSHSALDEPGTLEEVKRILFLH